MVVKLTREMIERALQDELKEFPEVAILFSDRERFIAEFPLYMETYLAQFKPAGIVAVVTDGERKVFTREELLDEAERETAVGMKYLESLVRAVTYTKLRGII